MNGLVTWAALSELNRPATKAGPMDIDPAKMWGAAAEMYNKMAQLEREYTENQLDALIITKEDTVLDVGCGPGRLSVPVASRAKSVTSLDVAPQMLAKCQENSDIAGVSNLTTRLLNWDDVKPGENVEKHDVVIASRTTALADLIKLNALAEKYVFILCWTKSPSLKEVHDSLFYGVDDTFRPMPPMNRLLGYNVNFNLLYDMGVNPSVKVVTDGFHCDYESREAAYDDLRTLHPVPEDREEVFRENVDRWLADLPEGGVSFRRETESYVMWWKPGKLEL